MAMVMVMPSLYNPALAAHTLCSRWLSRTDGKIYGVFASSEQCSNCTWRNPGTYQSLLYRTTTDTDYRKWEFVSVFWKAPPTQTNPKMGFTNCPDAFQLDDGRWVFAYLTHATQYGPTRILSFIGDCDDQFRCRWPVSGQGIYTCPPPASHTITQPTTTNTLCTILSTF